MPKLAVGLFALIGLTAPASLAAQAPPAEAVRPDPLPRVTVDQALATETHPLAKRVLQMLKVMEETVVEGKKPGFTEAGWSRYASFVDTAKFRRVDIFGASVGWNDYVRGLTYWARNYWYTGYVRRIREVGNLVYVENIERSSTKSPTSEDGAFHSIAVYTFDPADKIIDLEIYGEVPQGKTQ